MAVSANGSARVGSTTAPRACSSAAPSDAMTALLPGRLPTVRSGPNRAPVPPAPDASGAGGDGGQADARFASVVAAVTDAFGDPTRRDIFLYVRSHPAASAAEVAA